MPDIVVVNPMRNLLLFIWKNNFFFLFFLLEVMSFTLLVRHNYFQRAGFINSANVVTGTLLEAKSSVTDYVGLRHVNEQLALENARLHEQCAASYMLFTSAQQQVSDSVYKQQYQYISARVVGYTRSTQKNYMTLNRGFAQGIRRDMAVIAPEGVVGIVKDVSENFSSVMSVLHKDTHISSKLKKDGSFGSLQWDGDDYEYATLIHIPTHVKLTKGDTVTTSAYSKNFPENVMVGLVDTFEIRSGEHFYTIKVKLSTGFSKLSHVYVIVNLLKEEQETLEKKTETE